ncbi:MAG: ribonuclease D [Gemmatimonadetes bacterium]|nr:ribonuclease D [Gemmatimonadota bacterium]
MVSSPGYLSRSPHLPRTGPRRMTPKAPTDLIETPTALAAVLERFRQEPVVGIDTEAASFHRFHDRVYLLQISTPRETAVVDPVAVGSLETFGSWFQGNDTEFVFHDADYDLRLLHKQFGFRLRRLFDTRIAAQFLGLERIGLAAILEERFGVATNKKWQRADWSARPLSPEMIEYAATDTRYLTAVRDQFRAELEAKGRLGWVEEECQLSRSVEWGLADPPEVAFLKAKGARDLDRRGLAVLRELFSWRERLAARLDRALFRIVSTEVLIELSARRPDTPDALVRLRGIGTEIAARHGADIISAIRRGLAIPEAALPGFERRPRHRPDPTFEARLERLKAARTAVAERLQLPAGLVAPNATLEAIARAAPRTIAALGQIPSVRRWQVTEIGPTLIEAIAD